MNGSIMLESYPGVGSTFTFYFQLQPDNYQPNERLLEDEFNTEDMLAEEFFSDHESIFE